MHQEIELKLTARDQATLDELAERRELGGRALRPGPEHAIHDRYWDTPAGDLASRRANLRLRLQDGQPKFTLKRFGSAERGLFQRGELELPASAESWATIRATLAADGLSWPAPTEAEQGPSDWLRAAGLAMTQDRETRRRVLLVEEGGRAVVEIALDETTYHLGRYDVLFREVEIESLDEDVQPVLLLGRALEQDFGGRLTPSNHGKYRRGLDLAARLTDPLE